LGTEERGLCKKKPSSQGRGGDKKNCAKNKFPQDRPRNGVQIKGKRNGRGLIERKKSGKKEEKGFIERNLFFPRRTGGEKDYLQTDRYRGNEKKTKPIVRSEKKTIITGSKKLTQNSWEVDRTIRG